MRAVNLLPREHARQRRQAPPLLTQLLVAVPVLAAVLVGALWYFSGSGLPAKRAELQQYRDQLAAMPVPQATVQQSPVLTAQKAQRVAALAAALEGRVVWDRVLRHIASVLPGDVWLTKLTATPQQPTASAAPPPATTETTPSTTTSTGTTETQPAAPVATPATPSATPVEIDGYTYSHDAVARFLARLSLVPDLTDVQLKASTLSTIGTRSAVQFSITASVPPGGGGSS